MQHYGFSFLLRLRHFAGRYRTVAVEGVIRLPGLLLA
jgi:hypothetical protein